MKHTKQKSQTKEKNYSKDYAGTESSPYWDFLENMNLKEKTDIAESESLYYRDPSINEEQQEMVLKAWHLLTDRQKQALELVGLEGKTLENAGAIMGINKSNVLDLIKRARKIIKNVGNKQ